MSTEDCLFCRIIAGDVPSTKVFENDRAYAFRDIAPQAPTHVVVVPKEHYVDTADLARKDPTYLGEVLAAAVDVAEQEGLTGGYRILTNTGPDSGQTVFHLHLHVLGGRPLGALG
ncbi:MAG: histidine triad nucleotide-binding protein [Frankiales bacterium]|jgi:histidine triad (HIT) family protein|nr:histidine triad nucleotide-binding protein [Frankiales bacterium]